MGQTVQVDLPRLLEALVPDRADAIRQAFGGAPISRSGHVHITEADRDWYPETLIKLAEAACKEWSEPRWRAKRWMEAAIKAVRRVREATPETALAFLLRKGIQTLANDWYVVVPREWQDYALAAPSDAFAEFYGPLYASTVAGRVSRGERFPEGRIIGEDSVLVNQKFGLIEAFDRELFDDDQSGQIRLRAQRLGQSMAVTENAYAAIRFIGAAGSYSNVVVPATQYTTLRTDGTSVSGTPWDVTLYGTYGNRPTTYAALSLNLLKQAWAELLVALDPQLNKIIVNPNTLLVSAKDSLHAVMLVSPPAGVPYYPAVIGAAGQTASSAGAGFPGGVFGANPFMGLGIRVVVSRFLADWAWALGQGKTGFLFQERDPLEIVQEQVASGAAFEFDAYRFRSRRRFEAEWAGGGSRFWWLGNSGEVSGSF